MLMVLLAVGGSSLYYVGVVLIVLALIMNVKGGGCLFRIGMLILGLLLMRCC